MLNFLVIDVPNWIEQGLRALFYGLCTMIYRLVIGMYNIFELLCTVRILDMDVVESLAQRIGLILGLVMLFIVIFSLINSLINPDLLTDKTKSPVNIIKKVLLVIVMFGISTFAFNGLYYVQKVVIKSNVIVKLFVPAEVSTDNFGNLLTAEMFMNFYTINEDLDGVSDRDIDVCRDIINDLENNIINNGNFEAGKKCLYRTVNISGGDKVFIIDFSYVYSLIVGGFLVYFLFMYCLNVGVRTFQLVFLEIISPMAFVGYLSPKNDNMFSKWIKMYFSTYIDIFIRIGIISFVTFIISAILGNGTDYGNLVQVIAGTSGLTKILLEILLIFALLTFAKKAPDLLKELFPSGASKLGFGVGTPKQMFSNMIGDGNLVKRAYGAASVGARTVGRNLRKGVGNALATQFNGEKSAAEKKKAWLRAGGALFTGFGGMRRGLMTTDKSSRNRAVDNAYAATQSKYKMRDLGYGASALDLAKIVKGDKSGWKALGNQAMDKLRAAGMQDQYIEDLADMKDLSIESQREQLSKMQEAYKGSHTVSKSKSNDGMYIFDTKNGPVMGGLNIVTDASGNKVLEQVTHNGRDSYVLVDADNNRHYVDVDAVKIADKKSAIGKATADSKKLHQKAEEQKQGNKGS